MAETPETPTPSLAARLDDLANDRRWDCWSMHGERVQRLPEGYEPSIDCCDAAEGFHTLRAAAAQLRQLDRIKAALGPVSNIRRVGAQLPDCTSYSLASLGQWLTGVADALEADDV